MKNTDGGRIILFSGAGEGPQPLLSAYAASKGGITRFAESIAPELAPYGIFVNAIAPGPVKTQMLNDILNLGPTSLGEARYRRLLEQSARNSPENAIRLCNFLLSPRSRGLYGKTISAQWDEYESWVNLTEISEGSLYTMKRFTPQ
jgi:NAD(P)-dependent dehydrogenase (short-subunit alcohol dehydrogenase family)